MNDRELLTGIRELLAVPERWTKGWFARDKEWNPRAADSPDATCWCLYGAAMKVGGAEGNQATGRLAISLRDCIPAWCRRGELSYIAEFNDDPETTHEQIIAALDCAIAKLPPAEAPNIGQITDGLAAGGKGPNPIEGDGKS